MRSPQIRGPRLVSALAGAALVLTGCASGPPVAKPPEYASWSHAAKIAGGPPERVLIPRAGSPEYLRSWGVRQVNPDPAFRAGYTGRGVTIAVIDTGLIWAQPEVRAQAVADSTDLIVERKEDNLSARHGGELAGAISAALDGGGLVGVAYGAKLLSIRADIDGSCTTECAFRTADLARGLDYAVAHGAQIIVLAVAGQHRLSQRFEAAFQRAADSGAVIVVAAGNDSADNPTWPARYAADPRFAHAVVAVGASTRSLTLAGWSNRAGETRARYVAAPGEGVYAGCDEKVCQVVSGTSFAAPYVAGGIAIVMESRPGIAPQDAADILLEAARRPNLGAAAEATLGRGFLDIGGAVEIAKRRRIVAAREGAGG